MEKYYTEFSELLNLIKSKKPIVHHITNYVTVNDCANIVLAIGASPIMSDDINEVQDMVSIASSLVLNIGTLNKRTIESMLCAGKKAKEIGVPVVFDPVGAGASHLRNESAEKIINEVKPDIIRGNMSEIKAISGLGSATKGVDVSEQDMAMSSDLVYGKNIAKNLAERLNCIIAITGVTDIICSNKKTLFIDNGHKMLSNVTGTGCMCTSLIGSYCAVTKDCFSAAAAGILTMGISGEKAYESLPDDNKSSGSFRVKLIDSVFQMKGSDFKERGKIHE